MLPQVTPTSNSENWAALLDQIHHAQSPGRKLTPVLMDQRKAAGKLLLVHLHKRARPVNVRTLYKNFNKSFAKATEQGAGYTKLSQNMSLQLFWLHIDAKSGAPTCHKILIIQCQRKLGDANWSNVKRKTRAQHNCDKTLQTRNSPTAFTRSE